MSDTVKRALAASMTMRRARAGGGRADEINNYLQQYQLPDTPEARQRLKQLQEKSYDYGYKSLSPDERYQHDALTRSYNMAPEVGNEIPTYEEWTEDRLTKAQQGQLHPDYLGESYADGGDADIKDYERVRDEVAQQPQDVQQMTHLPDAPKRPVEIEGGLIGKKTLGQADYRVAPAMSGIAQQAYNFKTAPLYMTPLAPVAGALDATEGVVSGDPVQAAMGAIGAPGRLGKALAVSAAAMTPAEAQASFIGKRAKTAFQPALEAAQRLYYGAHEAGQDLSLANRDAWLFHGWGKDKAGNWKSEISDQNAVINPKGAEAFRNFEPGVKVGDVMSHPELYDAYPTSYSLKLHDVHSPDPNVRGSYDANNDILRINRKITDDDKLLDTLLHELQHRHDTRFEGHQAGGSPDMFPDMAGNYRREADHLAVADWIHQRMREGMGDWDAYRAAKDIWGGNFPQDFSKSTFNGIDPNTIAQRQLELADLIKKTPTPFDQYQSLVGEQMARLPGQRLKMDDVERRHNFPLEMPNGIVQPQYGIQSLNHGDAAWSRARNKRADGGEVVDEVHEHLQGLAGGGEVVERALKALGKLRPAGSGYQSVPGKPANVKIPGLGLVEARPIEPLSSAADSYMASIGRPGAHHVQAYPQFSEEMARKYAEAFDNLGHRPNDPAVRRAYDALAEETLAQYRALKDSGLDARFLKPGEADPYAASPSLGYADIVNNGKLHVFPTDQGFGTSDAFGAAGSPMLKRVGRIGDLDNATVNDAFRVVHDAYGHFAPGNPFFRAPGEERAFINHSKMYSPDALPAMATETRGQNSWVNYGPHGERNRAANGADTIYADQKNDIMPDWATRIDEPERAGGGQVVKRALDALGFYSKGAEVARGLQQKAGSPEALLNQLKKGGVKNTEINNADFLKETSGIGKMTRDDAADLFEAKKPQLREYLGDGDHTDFEPKYNDPKYKLPAGMYYNERLLALPAKPDIHHGYRVFGAFPQDFKTLEEAQEYAARFSPENLATIPGMQDALGPQLQRYPLSIHPDRRANPDNFQSSHWDEPNVLAHLRMNERSVGDRYTTHLEELQSDWAQKGRELGFKGNPDADHYAVPKAPYVDNTSDWADLGLKRALTVAAQNESDGVSVTPGIAQFQRWGQNNAAAGVQKFYDNTVIPKLTKMLGQPEMHDLPGGPVSMREINSGRIDAPTVQVPTFALPEETRDRILREGFPLFADGGAVDDHIDSVIDEAHQHAADPSLMDRAMSVISQLNPIGSAEAAPLDGVTRIIGKAATKVAKPAVKTTEPMLFDYSKLHEVPDVPQTDLQRYEPPRGVPDRTKALTSPENVARVNKVVEAGIPMGGREWYNTEPLRHAFAGELGPEEGAKAYARYLDMVAATSPRSNVGTNARNASYYYMMDRNGFSPSKPLPQPYGHIAQNLHMQNFDNVVNNGGWPVLQNPKPASFAQNLAGNQKPVTVDTHNARLWGMVDSKGNPVDLPSKTEYGFMERLQQEQAAKMGLTPAQYQAAAWIGGGAETGLKSSADPFLKVFEDRVSLTSKALGLSKEAVLQRMIRGEIPLKAEGGDVEQETTT